MKEFTIPHLRKHVLDGKYRTTFKRLREDGLKVSSSLYVELYEDENVPKIDEIGEMINKNLYGNRCSADNIIHYYFRRPDEKSFVLKRRSEIKGIMRLCPLDDATYFSLISIDRDARKGGLSKILLSLGMLYPLDMKHDMIVAKTRNPLSIRMACGAGFEYGDNIKPELKARCEDALSNYFFEKEVELTDSFIWANEHIDHERLEFRDFQDQDNPDINEFWCLFMGGKRSAILVKELGPDFDRASLFN